MEIGAWRERWGFYFMGFFFLFGVFVEGGERMGSGVHVWIRYSLGLGFVDDSIIGVLLDSVFLFCFGRIMGVLLLLSTVDIVVES